MLLVLRILILMAAVDFIDARSIEPVAVFEKDPAAHGDFDYLISAYTSHHAVAGYRLPNFLWKQRRFIDAQTVQEYMKIKTGIEIHPEAENGERFVIDHGLGTALLKLVKSVMTVIYSRM